RIDALNQQINAFVAVDADLALQQAAGVDQIVAAGGDPGPLAGIPTAVKDNEDTAGYRTTHGSPLLADAPRAVHDAPHVARLRAAGCVVVGKTNLPEFAWSANTTNTLFGATRNPWNLDHSAGGSSGGTAAALAAGLVPLATGSDGGGSIRIPSAACALSGMKPSLGRVPAGGAQGPGWLDFSTKGPMARRIADVITALDVVVGPEATDLRSLPRPEANWRDVLGDPHVPSRVAWSPTLGYAAVDRDVTAVCERALSSLESLGAEVVEIDPVFALDPVGDWLTFVGACLQRSLEPYREHPSWATMDPVLTAVVDAARSTSALDLVRIFDECHAMNVRLVEIFHDVRLLVTPTTAAPPPPLALGGAASINGELDPNWVKFTYPFNMTRSPAATVCAGLTEAGLPVGLQLIGPQHADLVVLRSAAAMEAAIGFDELAPIG
ncbi:MAG TPA: amidase family protein, partial [Acidimicrobiales bacterium]|nr:amidase family protein [Acidimicrobiales bacterium]